MELGARSIRSSGRGSGSIEITLPSRLRALSGLRCQVSWHDEAEPHITLTPDLAPAQTALVRFWDRLLAALELPARPMPPVPLSLAAQGKAGPQWEDAMALTTTGPHEAAAVSRVLDGLAGLTMPGNAGLAASLAFLATGAVPGAVHREDCAIAAAAFGARAAVPLDGFGDTLWQALPRLLPPLLALRRALAADPARHAELRTAAGAGGRIDIRGLLP